MGLGRQDSHVHHVCKVGLHLRLGDVDDFEAVVDQERPAFDRFTGMLVAEIALYLGEERR